MYTIDKTLDYVLLLTRHFDRDDVDAFVLALLLDFGFSTQNEGFHFLRQAILMRYNNPGMRFVKALYPEVGKLAVPSAGTGQVEQSIRNAINAAWECGDEELWRCVFSDRRGKLRKPASAEFIARVACVVELWSSCCREAVYERA